MRRTKSTFLGRWALPFSMGALFLLACSAAERPSFRDSAHLGQTLEDAPDGELMTSSAGTIVHSYARLTATEPPMTNKN